MANNQEIVNKYAESLLAVAIEHQELSAAKADIDAIVDVITSNRQVLALFELTSGAAEAQRVIIDALKQGAIPHIQNFLEVLFKNGRLSLILEIFEAFSVLYRRKTRTGQVKLTTAIPLTDVQLTKLSEELKGKFAFNALEIEQNVNPSILGGVIVEAESKIIDGSLKTQLDNIAAKL
ncbi:MAG: F0F1 ATP synthase subunit delta [Streptococcaceae bacterium]|jgi:F-type H+-transporting ATPase subunit delta|nr:F0F1 ATP synthase subunit delta [Streptococcaceae bacterium]